MSSKEFKEEFKEEFDEVFLTLANAIMALFAQEQWNKKTELSRKIFKAFYDYNFKCIPIGLHYGADILQAMTMTKFLQPNAIWKVCSGCKIMSMQTFSCNCNAEPVLFDWEITDDEILCITRTKESSQWLLELLCKEAEEGEAEEEEEL